ncbi:phosphate-binding protein PstS 1 precursor [Clostridium acetireducens DSM 10703]|jgi:phosphate transport system substrate-binding protein|uniref:Phosphate-binding protein n=1 Tax=Clostridium acetireducens DSM 10703 TaxID=1121290 RepID=A0A1E8EY20_9CLOT|nr:phosphate ABC transporter substrate-binding protein [Clostridium acetireducens]OFI05445.1 phosphate-binding protein PstS 1 precursor [Clostridium acetireducens DSM 10703]
MKKLNIKFVLFSLLICVFSIGIIGCSNKKVSNEAQNNSTEDNLSGTITSLGSSALQPLVEQAAKNFQSQNPKVTINVQGGGSGAGINQVIEGSVDIGNSDVLAEDKVKDKSQTGKLVDHKVCGIGFALIVNKNVNVDKLTSEQVQDIFQGKITNWKEVGGKDEPINIINRTKSSGTRHTFKTTVMGGKDEKDGIGTIQDSSGSVVKAVQNTKGSISYVALSYLTDEVRDNLKVLNIDGINPSVENIVSGKYKFWSYEHMYTNGKPNKLVEAFLNYMVSDENSKLIEKLGYISMKNLAK